MDSYLAANGEKSVLVTDDEVRTGFRSEIKTGPFVEEEEIALRGQLQSLLWSKSGDALILTSHFSIVWFDLPTHKATVLVTGESFISDSQLSPDGHTVSFIRDHAIQFVDTTTRRESNPAGEGTEDHLKGEPDWSYRNELGLSSAYWWSPDSRSIAWLETDDSKVAKYVLRPSSGEEGSIPYPKPGGAIPSVRLIVQSIATGKRVPIELGTGDASYLARVQWLPDGKQLAIERLSRDQKKLELLLANPRTGQARTIVAETDAYWINLSNDLRFLSDSKRFLWLSERDNYRHLYLYDVSGHPIAQLTHGNWAVTSVAGIDETEGVVYFTSTESGSRERQLDRVKLDGTGFERITHDHGTHEPMLSPARDFFVDTWSSHLSAPRIQALGTDGSEKWQIAEVEPNSNIAAPLQNMEFITQKTHMGVELNAWMMKPANFDPSRKYPVIFYVAGGPGEQIAADAWGGDKVMWLALMAQKGYVIYALDNRGSGGRGHLFEEPIHLRFSSAEMADVRDGFLYLSAQPWVDKGRIGLCGWGYGGFLAIHGMLDRPLLFKAAFAGSAVTDWHLYDAIFTEKYIEDPTRNQDGWLASSPTENAKNISGKLLLAQATLDEKVHNENALQLEDEMLDQGKYVDILLFADRKSLFDDRQSRRVLFERLTDFFLSNL
ncbi:S9 family peptidase [Acidicapsa dinghuensis]|uniref:S9 family peptidase n=1 Tax=Acidicapsa dinghuensis TaxID=2218256 RepID=A0ABW1EC03_9BACT|nr:S9 family peptidase [Acidicapsa dinghuensis]